MLHYPKNYEPTLFDRVYMAAHSKQKEGDWIIPDVKLRQTLHAAKRFKLSEPISCFMADLAMNAFIIKDRKVIHRRIESMRHSARLPHHVTWIEYGLRLYLTRAEEIRKAVGNKNLLRTRLIHEKTGEDVTVDPEDSPLMEGWLIEQHPQRENLFQAHIFSFDPDNLDLTTKELWLFPWRFVWTVDDEPVPQWMKFSNEQGDDAHVSRILTGIYHYVSNKVTASLATYADPILYKTTKNREIIHHLLLEWSGVMRRMWALLATINDIPVTVSDVTPSRGFMGRGQVRKFLPYKTLHLTVPQEEHRKLARHVLALSAKRAEHPVRGHYRIDFRQPPSKLCQHTWDAHEVCTTCKGHRIHIREHMRGDPKLGHIDHNYTLQHQSERSDA